jgi:hemolysin D
VSRIGLSTCHPSQQQDSRSRVEEGLCRSAKLNLLDAVQSQLKTKSQIAGDVGRRAMAVATLRTQQRETVETSLADQGQKLSDARRTADEKVQDAAKARARLDLLTLRAPIAGRVEALSVVNRGQVVSSGQEVMRIVPSDDPITIRAYVSNDDIGFVSVGQTASVKVDSFPFTQFGLVQAVVSKVAYDAIPADAADQRLMDAAHEEKDAARALTPSSAPMTDLVFETELRPEARAIRVQGRMVALAPGMTVTVEIRTGSRRILQYLFSPLIEVGIGAMKER